MKSLEHQQKYSYRSVLFWMSEGILTTGFIDQRKLANIEFNCLHFEGMDGGTNVHVSVPIRLGLNVNQLATDT